jgi:hypothetical protein
MADAGADQDAGAGSLLVLIDSAGSGLITSDVPGISCPSDCYAHYPFGTKVTITVTPDSQSSFYGYIGSACVGTGPCTIVIDGDKSVIIEFGSLEGGDAGASDAGFAADASDAAAASASSDAGASGAADASVGSETTLSTMGGCSVAHSGAHDGALLVVAIAVLSTFRAKARRSVRRRC